MSEPTSADDPLIYEPSKVSWTSGRFIAQAPSFASRAFLYAVMATMAGAFVYSALARVAVSVETGGMLVSRDAILPVLAPFALTVATVHVKENQRVKRGDVLFESKDRVTEEEFQLVSGQAKKLEQLLERERNGPCGDCAVSLRALAENAFQLDNQGQIRLTLAELRRLVLELSTTLDSFNDYAASTRATRRRIAVASAKLKEIRARNAEQALAMQVEALTQEVVAAQSELAEGRRRLEAGLTQARDAAGVRLAETMKELELYRTQNTIVAPTDGVISDLAVSGVGQLVAGGQQLLKIIPSDSGLVAELLVANRDISKVKVGLPVRIKLDALPEREYGVLNGTVESIGADVVKAGVPGVDGSYRVRAQLETQAFIKDDVVHPFRLGMTLSALIVVKHESMLMSILRKVFNIKDELFGD